MFTLEQARMWSRLRPTRKDLTPNPSPEKGEGLGKRTLEMIARTLLKDMVWYLEDWQKKKTDTALKRVD